MDGYPLRMLLDLKLQENPNNYRLVVLPFRPAIYQQNLSNNL